MSAETAQRLEPPAPPRGATRGGPQPDSPGARGVRPAGRGPSDDGPGLPGDATREALRAEPAGAPSVQSWTRLAHDLYLVSKPRILFLLLVVAWAAMFVAAGGWPDLTAFIAVTLAGACSTAASGAFNHVLEASRDARMARTADRPVASGRLSKDIALAYGVIMAALGLAILHGFGFVLAAWLNLLAAAYYVVGYTLLLKPRTPQNIVIGGAAGSFPALIGWAAQAGTLALPAAWPAWALAALVFLWTPAHFWALALLYKDDYAAADYPMMPNVRGEASTRRQVLLYAGLTAAASLALVPVAGLLYLAAAVALGATLVGRAWRMSKAPTPQAYRGLFFWTIQYLGLLLVALMADLVLPLPALWA